MRTLLLTLTLLLACGNAGAEECADLWFAGKEFKMCQVRQMDSIARSLEEIARKMPETKEEKEPTYAK